MTAKSVMQSAPMWAALQFLYIVVGLLCACAALLAVSIGSMFVFKLITQLIVS